jgi:hypothetical protein
MPIGLWANLASTDLIRALSMIPLISASIPEGTFMRQFDEPADGFQHLFLRYQALLRKQMQDALRHDQTNSAVGVRSWHKALMGYRCLLRRQTRAFGLVPVIATRKVAPLAAGGVLNLKMPSTSCAGAHAGHRLAWMLDVRGASSARGGSAKGIFGAGHKKTVQPVSLQTRSCSRRTVVVVAREELAAVDPQLTVEEMQLFDAGMSVRWVARAGREAHQHADPVPFGVGCE